ncbi:MAG TPA: hypothetical protein ENN80_04795, partial [Candidatus Hydrogenedentes bacterium]|nr:hypothetical protein [Candidatus Hydrogenedentota bacterium]
MTHRAAEPCTGRRFFPLVLAFFFVSGASGLLYQVVWTRRLVLLFGAAHYAVSTVLCVFFLGLGAGSLWGGRLADRVRRPLWVYGVFEVIIGLWAALLIGLFDRGESVIVLLMKSVPALRVAAIGLRGALTVVFLIVPVTLMGATLPLLARDVARHHDGRGLRIGALYSLNTFGAVAGCALTGFVFLERFGYARSTLLGVAANLSVGLAAMAIGWRADREPEALHAPLQHVTPHPYTFGHTVLLAAYGLSGFCALALEVLWTRLLSLVFVGTTYAFTTVLATVLVGIATGSAVASFLADRCRRNAFLFGCIEILIGVACIVMLAVVAGLPERLQAFERDLGFHWDKLVYAKFVLAFSALFAPTFLFGMTFPLVIHAATENQGCLGRNVGRFYSANTLGGVLGALAGGYVLIPLVGTHDGVLVLAGILFGVGVLVIAVSAGGHFPRFAAVTAGAALLLAAHTYAAPSNVCEALNEGYLPQGERLIHFCEGVEATVAVSEPLDAPKGADRMLWINAVQATASIEKGVRMNRFQGLLPLLFNRDPQRVL